ncbi:MAG: DUF5606 domain-containing protein [Rikenellaceae bacterium]
MKMNEILAISGQPGLYKYVAQSTRGVIVESLSTGKRTNVSGNAPVSAISEISMFTEGDDIALPEIFTRLYAYTEGKAAINHKESAEKIKAEFEAFFPEYDKERVRVSDMKKCFNWFNALVAAGATEFTVPTAAEQTEATEAAAE